LSNSEYITALKKTALSSIMGVLAGVVAFFIATGPDSMLQREGISLISILFFIWIQQSIFPFIGVDAKKFSGKDWAFIGMMTFFFAYMIWVLLLNL